MPLLIAGDTNLIATVPRELGRIFAEYKAIRIVETPIALPRFALRQHWHPRFHHDEANAWLRKLVKDTFESYPSDRSRLPRCCCAVVVAKVMNDVHDSYAGCRIYT